MSDQLPIDVKYGIIATDPQTGKLLHFVGYEELPTDQDMVDLREEFLSSPELGLSEKPFVLRLAPEHLVMFHRNLLSSGYKKFTIKGE